MLFTPQRYVFFVNMPRICCKIGIWNLRNFYGQSFDSSHILSSYRLSLILSWSDRSLGRQCIALWKASSIHRPSRRIKPADCQRVLFVLLRKERDSNPRYVKRTTVFETAPIDHSGIFPMVVLDSGYKISSFFLTYQIFMPPFLINFISAFQNCKII